MTMKKCMKEVWVKFSSQAEYSENEERLFALLDEAPGEATVKVYDASTKGCKILSGHNFDEEQISMLADFLGENNVKYLEKEMEVQQRAQRQVPDIVQIIPCNWNMYAVVRGDDGAENKYRVLVFALCNDGQVYPLYFDSWLGISILYSAIYDVDGYELEGGEICQEGGKPDEQK